MEKAKRLNQLIEMVILSNILARVLDSSVGIEQIDDDNEMERFLVNKIYRIE